MNASGCKQFARVFPGQCQCGDAALFAGARHHHLGDSGFACSLDNLTPIAAEGIMCQVAADVDQFHFFCLVENWAHCSGFPHPV
jgi:hypothetical protein